MNQPRLDFESLSFKIGISGTYWGKKPQYEILINDTVVAQKEISQESKKVEYTEFKFDIEEDKEFILSIRLTNKEDSDTVLDETNTVILKDMLLNIESIEIEDIELEFLKWTLSSFVPDDPKRPKLECCVNLGWNGSYKIVIGSPFYLWLLENM